MMESGEQKADVIVIGGGLAGLAAATFLSRGGRRVRLLEQSHAPGGRAQTRVHDGFFLNIGPHALYRGGHGIEVLRELGVEPQGAPPPISGAFAINGGVKHTFPSGPVSLLTTSLFGLPAKLETARLLGSLAKIDGEAVMGVTAREWVDSHISHSAVRDLILATFRLATYTNADEQMSAGAAIEQLKKALGKGVLYLDGGWQTLVDGLARAATSAGVVVETGAKVERIERGVAGQVQAVRLSDGRLYKTATAVIASSPDVAARLVEGGPLTSLAGWADEAKPVRAASLDLALSRLPVPKAKFALGIDRPLYLSVHSASARLAPEGGAMIHVAKYLPPDRDESAEEIGRELESLLDLVQPGWRDALIHRRLLPDMVVTNAITAARRAGTEGRPGPRVEDVPGLFVVGDWVGKEGLLADASLASARQAAKMIAAQGSLAAAV